MQAAPTLRDPMSAGVQKDTREMAGAVQVR